MAISSEVSDRLLDHATQTAIHCADHDYMRWKHGEDLGELAKAQFNQARESVLADVSDDALAFYAGTFAAAYRRRSQTLRDFPVARHEDGTL